MGYRGNDLDLRVGGRLGPAVSLRSARRRAAAIRVDEVLLACCNHAFDLAEAHGSVEVSPEHLLCAMSRIEPAIESLERRGIDVESLRRDSAATIVDGLPVLEPGERTRPRKSETLEDVLRLAEAEARLEGSPATVDHVLDVLSQPDNTHPGVTPLRRPSSSWNLRDPLDPRAESLPSRGLAGEPRHGVAGASMSDAMQNSRLDHLERTVRELIGELAVERAAEPAPPVRERANVGDRLAAIEAALFAARGEHTAPPPVVPALMPIGVSDRIAAVERGIEARFGELARTWALLGDRLQSLENAVMSARGDGGTLPPELVERLQGLDGYQRRFDDLERVFLTLADRLGAIERALASRPGGVQAAADLSPLTERIAGLERTIANQAPAAVNLAPVNERLTAIEDAITTQPAAVADLGPVMARIQSIDLKFADSAKGAQAVAERLGRLEHMMEEGVGDADRSIGHVVERVRALQESLESQSASMRQLATSVAGQQAGGERFHTLVSERVQGLAHAFERQRGELAQPLLERIGGIGQLVETRHAEMSAVFGQLAERLVQTERRIAADQQARAENDVARQRELAEVHEALVKLNTNQQTIANSIDQWRLDNTGDLGQLANKLDAIERSGARRATMLDSLSSSLSTLQQISLKKEENKSRFRHWLMGTDDWYGASWEGAGAPPQQQAVHAGGSNGSSRAAPPPIPRPAATAGERR